MEIENVHKLLQYSQIREVGSGSFYSLLLPCLRKHDEMICSTKCFKCETNINWNIKLLLVNKSNHTCLSTFIWTRFTCVSQYLINNSRTISCFGLVYIRRKLCRPNQSKLELWKRITLVLWFYSFEDATQNNCGDPHHFVGCKSGNYLK